MHLVCRPCLPRTNDPLPHSLARDCWTLGPNSGGRALSPYRPLICEGAGPMLFIMEVGRRGASHGRSSKIAIAVISTARLAFQCNRLQYSTGHCTPRSPHGAAHLGALWVNVRSTGACSMHPSSIKRACVVASAVFIHPRGAAVQLWSSTG